MHRSHVGIAAVFFCICFACSSSNNGSGSTGPANDGGTAEDGGADGGGTEDGGTGSADAGDAGSADAGDAGLDGGTASGDAGADGGVATSCNGLTPGNPPAPLPLLLTGQDVDGGTCAPAETEGTGNIAVKHQDNSIAHTTLFTFFSGPQDAGTDDAGMAQTTDAGAVVGTYQATNSTLLGQKSGFMGADCSGPTCQQDVFVLDPNGKQLFKSAVNGNSNNVQANDPAGGMVHVRLQGAQPVGSTATVDSIDTSGKVRWSKALPDVFLPGSENNIVLGVDRAGNTLALWEATARFGGGTWAGQWFDATGNPGQVFLATKNGQKPAALYERIDTGLFLTDGMNWLGQFDSMATTLAPAPSWLMARPNSVVRPVHDTTAYGVVPNAGIAGVCQQQIEVVTASGQSCGSATFAVDTGNCTTNSIILGVDGTVVQQLPREREAACIPGQPCNCTWRAWPGFFR
jgi:hypothetical protein